MKYFPAVGLEQTLSESVAALLLVAEASTPLNPPNPVPPPNVDAEPKTGVGDAACSATRRRKLHREFDSASRNLLIKGITNMLHILATDYKHMAF